MKINSDSECKQRNNVTGAGNLLELLKMDGIKEPNPNDMYITSLLIALSLL